MIFYSSYINSWYAHDISYLVQMDNVGKNLQQYLTPKW